MLTLKRRYLDNLTKEIVWLGILIAVEEKAGRIHLQRAREAGITSRELRDLLTFTQLARGFNTVEFVGKNWTDMMTLAEAEQNYLEAVDHLSENSALTTKARELLLIGVHAALVQRQALQLHIKRAKRIGLADEDIGEAISYVIIPCGGNVLLKAAEVIKDMASRGEFGSKGAFGSMQKNN